ncbi:pyrroloquinoline quinone precursor peptide PqqA [Paucibacter sp. R3-3]|uniref:Coenzyme PQQ synthesis protein A n=1 Tax=Roseateles agri TaxID=3098619 RepID=A0ABU5DEA8_9BURK|nr:pyrroloquinoline quinone precursor peptide PqqA [Paucibacter sp. R3-3]MDY0744474.1 pyrroloquinoline quinone precursor peptide PqqA [Paucibacter sp. R3-3]
MAYRIGVTLGVIHDFHEGRIKGRGWPAAPIGGSMVYGMQKRPASSIHKETTMTWTTPTAQDFRFGFEITAYSAAR